MFIINTNKYREKPFGGRIMNNEYCYNCDEFVNVLIKEEIQKFDIKGINIEFLGEVAYCDKCHEKVNIYELDDVIVEKANKIYRDKKDIIQISEIELLLKKYQIGKKPLAKLLGWGENTIVRYLDGLTPSMEYSQRLKDLLMDSSRMKKLLLENKGNITKIAFEKSLNSMIVPTDPDENEILGIAEIFIERSKESITPLKLQKLLYYFHVWSLIFLKLTIKKDFQAWVYGPVLPCVYDYYKDYGSKTIKSSNIISKDLISGDVKELVDAIYLSYGKYEAFFLKDLTHKEDPWNQARENLNEKDSSSAPIKNEHIFTYYSKEKNVYNIKDIHGLNKYISRKVFECF